MLATSIPTGDEAPIRFYLSEDSDGGSALACRTPSTVFVPYMEKAEPDLRGMASEPDSIFAAIAKAVTE